MMIRRIRHFTRALTLLFVASILTTCGDDSSSSKDDRGVYGEMADALREAEEGFLTANADIFTSADSMMPFIASALDLQFGSTAFTARRTSCLPDGAGGQLYVFDGDSYTGILDPNVPEEIARFVLYGLSETGLPALDNPIGVADYGCTLTDWGVATYRLRRDSTLAFSIEYAKYGGGFSGSFVERGAPVSLIFDGGINHLSAPAVYFQVTSGTVALVGFPDFSGSITQYDSADSLKFEFSFHQVSSGLAGCAFLRDPGGDIERLVACISGSTPDSLIFADPSSPCICSSILRIDANQAQLESMARAHKSLQHLGLMVQRSVNICRTLVPE